jgi:hypothetical protein
MLSVKGMLDPFPDMGVGFCGILAELFPKNFV